MASEPRSLRRYAGQPPADGSRAAAPWRLSIEIRDYAKSKGFVIERLQRSRARESGSIYLNMRDVGGRLWILRVSNHFRPRRTGHAMPHVDFVSFDGVSGVEIGRQLVDAVSVGKVPWFNAEEAISLPPRHARQKRRRKCRK